MASKELTWQQKEWAYEKWCLGYTQMQIAESLSVCEKTIQRAIKGKPRIRPILIYDREERKEMQCKAVKDGVAEYKGNIGELAMALGVSNTTVSRARLLHKEIKGYTIELDEEKEEPNGIWKEWDEAVKPFRELSKKKQAKPQRTKLRKAQ